jgi:hypothetical protein
MAPFLAALRGPSRKTLMFCHLGRRSRISTTGFCYAVHFGRDNKSPRTNHQGTILERASWRSKLILNFTTEPLDHHSVTLNGDLREEV